MKSRVLMTNDDQIRKKVLEKLLAETNTTLEEKVAALKTVHAVDRKKINAALSSMMKKD